MEAGRTPNYDSGKTLNLPKRYLGVVRTQSIFEIIVRKYKE